MNKTFLKIVSIQLIFFITFTHTAWAGFISTSDVVSQQKMDQNRAEILNILEREDVRKKLLEYGVMPSEAAKRVAALSDSEVAQLKDRLDSTSTGEGVVGPIVGGIVIIFLVLLFTDIIGETDVFDFDD
jgi:hypothetical protein